MTILEQMRALLPGVVALRRDFHAHPELGFQERRTSAIVAKRLEACGLEVKTRFCKAETAVLGILETGRPGPAVALRADMDALPMRDRKQTAYRSQNDGVCHACGHDGHTAALLGLAEYCAGHRAGLRGRLIFVFQPAEEGPAPGGAKYIMESGALSGVDAMLGCHQSTTLDTGRLLVRYGTACASGDSFDICLTGEGAHAVSPQLGNDVIVTAAQIIGALQALVTRGVNPQDPVLLSVCSLAAGEPGAKNVLPDRAALSGTLRTFNEQTRERVFAGLEKTVGAIAALNGCGWQVKREQTYPSFANNARVTAVVERAARRVAGGDNVVVWPEASMGSEDFAWYANSMPASFFMFGVKNEAKGITWPGHHPLFDMDEEALPYAMAVMWEAAWELLNGEEADDV